MPIPLPNLDDRRFADLADEMRARIARFAPEWTNHNVADPGIMLLELFAWLTESTIYRINRVPESSRVRFLEMLGGLFDPAQPATVRLDICAPKFTGSWTLPRGTVLTTSRFSAGEALRFETLRDVTLQSPSSSREIVIAQVAARQTALISEESLGSSSGEPFQLLKLSHKAIVLPANPFPIRPEVSVAGEPWTYVPNFSNSQRDDRHFTVKLWLNAIAFGDDAQGRTPPAGAKITAGYRYAPTRAGLVKNEALGTATGRSNQHFRLQKKLLALDLRPHDVFEPEISVDGKPWRYRSEVLDMGKEAAEFTIEPSRNAVRMGNGDYGRIPPPGQEICATYRYTVRPMRTLAPQTLLTLADADAVSAAPDDLMVTVNHVIFQGADATDLDGAHDRALNILKPRWRAISTNDVEAIIEGNDFDIARAKCLPGRNIDLGEDAGAQPGHVTTVVLPKARHRLDVETYDLSQVLEISPDGAYAVAVDHDDVGWLLNLQTPNVRHNLGLMRQVRTVMFTSGGKSLITEGDNDHGRSILRATATGHELARLLPKSTIRLGMTGIYLVDMAPTGQAFLRNAQDGATIIDLESPVKLATFGAGDDLLATAGDNLLAITEVANSIIRIWDTVGGAELYEFLVPGRITTLVFSRDGGQLATADEGGVVRLWRIGSGSARSRKEFEVQQPVDYLAFSDDGTRLVEIGAGKGRLWSTRTGRQINEITLGDGILDAQFSPNSQWLVLVHADGAVRLWNARNGDFIGGHDRNPDEEDDAALQVVVFSPSSRRLTALWVRPETVSHDSIGHRKLVDRLPEADFGRTHSDRYTVRVWDLTTLTAEFHPVWQKDAMAATVDESGAWVCYADGNLLRLWDTEEMGQSSVLFHHRESGEITGISDIPGGKYLVVKSRRQLADVLRQTVQIWNAQHVADVRTLLQERRLVTSQHHVAGPVYTNVYVTATIAPGLPLRARDQLQREIAAVGLYSFFAPLSGGPDGQGWPWGRDVYASEIYQIMEGIAGVDHVESLTLTTTPAMGTPVEEGGPAFLPISPYHLVNYVVRPEAISFVGEAKLHPQNITYRTR